MIVTHTERERERGRGRSRLHAPGARRGIRSRVSRIAPWAKGRRQTARCATQGSQEQHFKWIELSLLTCSVEKAENFKMD